MKLSDDACALCQRNIHLTFHHLIPRKLHRRKRFSKRYSREELNTGIMLCHRCHRGIHKLYDEMELGSQLNTASALKEDPKVAKHIAWVAKQQN